MKYSASMFVLVNTTYPVTPIEEPIEFSVIKENELNLFNKCDRVETWSCFLCP